MSLTTSTARAFGRRLLAKHAQRTSPILPLHHHQQQQHLFSTTTAAASVTASGFDKVGVIGLGLMGHGICQVAAASGIHSKGIVAYEPQQEFLDKGKERIEQSLAKLVSKGRVTQETADQTMGSIQFTTDISQLSDADMIVEAVIEKMELKEEIYTSLGQICDEKTIFASNTSGLSITEMAQFSGRTDRFLGVHFFNPVQLMKLVEVIRTEDTDPVVFDKCYAWVSAAFFAMAFIAE